LSNQRKFTAGNHADLFALLSRSVITHLGAERGEKIVRMAVRRYGEQRGYRMALRALRDGEPLTMLNYMAYGEWRGEESESEQHMVEMPPDVRSLVTRCPWNQAWRESDLLQVGRLYCLEIDHALVRGFNPALRLDVLSTLSNNERPCEFVFYDANLTPENLALLNQKKSANQQKGAVMPWEYHAGHLFAAIKACLVAEVGDGGEVILQEALAGFAKRYGTEAVRTILSYQGVDFNSLPEQGEQRFVL
jgi:hypothetical protein